MKKKKDKSQKDIAVSVASGEDRDFMPVYAAKRQYPGEDSHFIPIDFYETKEFFVLEVEIPGVLLKDIKISICGDDLCIEGTKYEKLEPEGKVNFLCMERSFGPFRREIKVEASCDKSSIKAFYTKGILFIKLPKKEERRERVRYIPIEKEENE